jgi:hypothetical protein
MGGGNSVETKITNITKVVSNTILSTIQSTSNETMQVQELIVDCSNEGAAARDKKKRECLLDTVEILGPEAGQVCARLFGCGASNISMKGVLNVDYDISQDTEMTATIKTKLKNALESSIEQENSLGTFGNSVKTGIDNVVAQVTEINLTTLQDSFNDSQQKQSVIVKGGTAEFIDMKSAGVIVTNIVQDTKVMVDAISELENSIKSQVKQDSGLPDIQNIIIAIIVGIIVFFIFIGLGLWIFKKSGAATDMKNSVNTMKESKASNELDMEKMKSDNALKMEQMKSDNALALENVKAAHIKTAKAAKAVATETAKAVATETEATETTD